MHSISTPIEVSALPAIVPLVGFSVRAGFPSPADDFAAKRIDLTGVPISTRRRHSCCASPAIQIADSKGKYQYFFTDKLLSWFTFSCRRLMKICNCYFLWALLHKSAIGQDIPNPKWIYAAATVWGVPSAVN